MSVGTKESSDLLISRLEEIYKRKLTEEEVGEIQVWNKGRALSQIVNFFGFEVLLEMIGSYRDGEIKRLLATDPSDKDAVLAAHATAFGMNRMYVLLIEDVNTAINESAKTPELIKGGLKTVREASPVPLESLG